MENKPVDLSKRVTVIGTGKSRFMPKGAKYEVHPLNADALVKAGKAAYEKDGI